MDIKRKFGLVVRERRNALGISQEELAMRIDADQAYVSRIETGQMNATLETIEDIANALEVNVCQLIGFFKCEGL